LSLTIAYTPAVFSQSCSSTLATFIFVCSRISTHVTLSSPSCL
jgi:hypothetical protein